MVARRATNILTGKTDATFTVETKIDVESIKPPAPPAWMVRRLLQAPPAPPKVKLYDTGAILTAAGW